MSPWRCAPRKGCLGHMFGKCCVLHSLLGSYGAHWDVKSAGKPFKEDTFYFFKSSVSANHLTVGQPSHHKKSWLPPPLSVGGVFISISGIVVSRTCFVKHCARPVACRRSGDGFPWLMFCSFTG